MFGISDRLFGSSKQTLVDNYAITVEKEGEEVIFNPSFRSDRNAELVMDGESYEVDSEMAFSYDYLESENAVVVNSGRLLHNFSTEKVEESINIIFLEDQISEIQNITLNRNSEVLESDSEYEFDVFMAEDNVIISVNGFYVNNPIRMDIGMSGSYPSVSIRSVSPNNQFIDLAGMEKRKVRFESNIRFTGDASFKGNKLDFTTGNTYNIARSKKMYCEYDEIQERIEEWNDTDFEVKIYPDSYRPILSSPDRVVDGTVIISISDKKITPLSEIKVKYPEWVVGISPRLCYDTMDPRSKYSKKEKTGRNEYAFKNVIPSEDLRLFHGGGVMRFEENILDIEKVKPNVEKSIDVDLNPRRKAVIINCKRDDTVNFLIGDQSKQVQSNATDVVEIDPSNVRITVKSTENELIDEINISKDTLLKTREIVLIDESLNLS